MSAPPDVLVVVVTYESEDVLPGFFDALGPGMAGIDDFAVAVSDNASADRSIAVAAERWPDAHIVASELNAGYAAAINAAVGAVGAARAILVLNDDVRLAPGSVATLLERLDGDVGVVVPRLIDGEGRLLLSQRRFPTVRRALGEAVLGGERAGRRPALGETVVDVDAYGAEHDVDWASGCAWLISRACWDRVGEWDESLFLYGEDLDYALRMRDARMRIRFTPDAEVVHLVGPSHHNPRLWSMLVWNRYRVYRRRHGAVASTAYRSALIANEATRALMGRQVHRAGLGALVSAARRPPEVRDRGDARP